MPRAPIHESRWGILLGPCQQCRPLNLPTCYLLQYLQQSPVDVFIDGASVTRILGAGFIRYSIILVEAKVILLDWVCNRR